MNQTEIELVKSLAKKFPQTSEETILKTFDAWKQAGYKIPELVAIFYRALESAEVVRETKIEQTSFDF